MKTLFAQQHDNQKYALVQYYLFYIVQGAVVVRCRFAIGYTKVVPLSEISNLRFYTMSRGFNVSE